MLLNIILLFFNNEKMVLLELLASFCTQFLTALAQILLCFKIFELKNLKYLVEPVLVFIIGVILIGFLTISYSQLWYINICIFVFIYL